MTQQEKQDRFLLKAKRVHCKENLDYSKVFYINNRTHIIIIDRDIDKDGNEYGEYKILPCNFLKGQGHPKKRGLKISQGKRSKQEDIIKRFEEVHKGENLDYSKVNYVNMHTKVCIIDPIFGEYWQEPVVHLKGCGHPKKTRKHQLLENVKDNYISQDCSKFEDEIAEIIPYKVIKHDKTILDGKEIDIYIPEKKIGIEFNGLRWHTEWFGGKGRHYHQEKTDKCIEKGVRLIQIFEDEYKNKELVKEKIKHILGLCENLPKIYARKCEIRVVDKHICDAFLNKYHIQGKSDASIRYGAFYNGAIVGVMSFKREGKEKWELVRFASDYHYICCGVGGKLFSRFVKDNNPKEVKSFADRRWTIDYDNNLYVKLGFKFAHNTPSEYRYFNQDVDRMKRFHKFVFRKKNIISKYGKEYKLDMSMTESEMMKKIGFDRIWDCGLIKYVWHNN